MLKGGLVRLPIETTGLTAKVNEGVLRYGGTYTYSVVDISTTDEVMNEIGPIYLKTGAKPEDEDDYGTPLIAQGLSDVQGQRLPLADNNLSTLIAVGGGLLPQEDILAAIQDSGGVMKDSKGTTVATMNINDVRVLRSEGGLGKEIVMAASNNNLIATVRPLTTLGYAMDKSGKLNPMVTITPSNISLPLGLFDFTVSIDNGTSTNLVIVPPEPLLPNTKWYKVSEDGKLKEYPNFVVDAKGNGILTLYDNDEWDKNPAFGFIRDPGGPGTTLSSSSSCYCFIATAAYGSYLHPFVNILRTFRDRVLLVSSIGSSFVEWYYRVSPPIANVISQHSMLSAAMRILLLPAIGIAWLCLKAGVAPAVFLLLAFCAFIAIVIRNGKRRFSHTAP